MVTWQKIYDHLPARERITKVSEDHALILQWCGSYPRIESLLLVLLRYFGIYLWTERHGEGNHTYHSDVLKAFDSKKNPLNSVLGHEMGWYDSHQNACVLVCNHTRYKMNGLKRYSFWHKHWHESGDPVPKAYGEDIDPASNYRERFMEVITSFYDGLELCIQTRKIEVIYQAKERKLSKTLLKGWTQAKFDAILSWQSPPVVEAHLLFRLR